MDAAKPSTDGKSKPTANDPGTASKPADAAGSASAKRPEQMFVVQKSGPIPAGATPAATPANAPKNAFQTAITQGAGAKSPAGGQPAVASHGMPPQGVQGMPAPAQGANIQAIRTQAGVPAMAVEAGLPELADVEVRPDPLLSCLVILTRLFGNPKSLAALAAGLPI